MCGIVGYSGPRESLPILIKGLKRLEYRGYDSAGVALLNGGLDLAKCAGKVSDLEALLNKKPYKGTTGIGHTRWATHGPPNDANAHPHLSGDGKLALIHNGIIENYASIKKELVKRGFTFKSDTDTEVLTQLIQYIMQGEQVPLKEAIRRALEQVVGAYAIAVISVDEPDKIVVARKGSPLVIGVGEKEYFLASDATPIVEYTKNVVYLNDGEIAVLKAGEKLEIFTIANEEKTPFLQELTLNIEMIEKGGFEHFMLKEIYEQPRSILDSLRGRMNSRTNTFQMSGVAEYKEKFLNARRLIIVGCGTSWHAGLIGEYLFEEFARIPVEVEYASEFRYRNPVLSEEDIVIAISQSGETADTLAAIELAKSKGATIFGITNVVGSSIARASDGGAYTHAGPEIGVASTKAFTAQVTVLTLIALSLAQSKGLITKSRLNQLLVELENIPEKVEVVLKTNEQITGLAKEFASDKNALYLGRGYNFPVALEGALKLKEISYIHAEGYPAAEMKHGPIALIDENMPVVVVATRSSIYEKVISNIQEIRARNARVLAIVTQGDTQVKDLAHYSIEVPATEECLDPLISTIPLQLLAYHIAVLRGCNVDQPRNLAKSVTVE